MIGVPTLPLHRVLAVAGWSAAAMALVVLSLGVGHYVPTRPLIALFVVVAVLAFGLTLADPAVLPLLALVPMFVILRVPLGTTDVSFSDVALGIAFVPAVLLGKRPYSAPMRSLIWLTVVYQLATLFTVIANPYARNAIEWFHAWLLTAGALVVGWTIGRGGHARTGLTILLGLSVVLAISTLFQGGTQWASGNFGPVYTKWPFLMHKNFVGGVLGLAATLAYARPAWMGWSRAWSLSAFWICALGILASQSRQALIGLVAALLVLSLRDDAQRRRSRLILLTVVPALIFVGTLVRDQLASGNQFNSTFQRLHWFVDSLHIWKQEPLVGVGLRWWYTDRFTVAFQPPNAEMEVLSSAGIIGLAAFVIMLVGTLRVLWSLDRAFGTLAFAVVLSRVVQGQFDIFWVSVSASLPFLIVGICLGALAHADEESPPASSRDPVDDRELSRP